MAKSFDSFTQQELFDYALISAELFPLLSAVQVDENFFTHREQDILHHLLRDKSLNEISTLVGLAAHAVKYHIEAIKNKMKLTKNSLFVTQLLKQLNKFVVA
ncbi:MAG: LuxR C-terminal-related transcriptional regulator [Gammaproteobacteria bacterium]|nr:LuxR C-terminal-related transcriptional regulator [Gammaproteobacteria bacterium]